MIHFSRFLFCFLSLFFLTGYGAQRIDVQDGIASVAQISMKEPTRIKVEGAAITDVLGNVFHKDKNPGGEILIEEDKVRGEIFVWPHSTASSKPINLFVMTATATFTLLLQPVDVPADTIVLFDRTKRIASLTTPAAPGQLSNVKTLIAAMASDRVPSSVRVTEIGRDIRLRPDAQFTLQRQYESAQLIADRYLLTNVGTQAIALIEQEFYVDGVLAVAIDKSALLPGESTAVYVVRTDRSR